MRRRLFVFNNTRRNYSFDTQCHTQFAPMLNYIRFGLKSLSRKALNTTDTELKLIAAAAIIGFNKAHAATGIPIIL